MGACSPIFFLLNAMDMCVLVKAEKDDVDAFRSLLVLRYTRTVDDIVAFTCGVCRYINKQLIFRTNYN